MPFCILSFAVFFFNLIEISSSAQNESNNIVPEKFLKLKFKGGKPVEIKNFPFVVSIQKQSKPKCEGTLIGESWVVTVAHCLVNLNIRITKILDPADYIVVSGRTILSSGITEGQKRRPKIKSLPLGINRSSTKRFSLKYDVGLIKTYIPFVYGKYTNAIETSFPTSKVKNILLLIGWNTGRHYFDDYEEPELKPNRMELNMMKLKRMTPTKCKAILGSLVTEATLCTYLFYGDCPGDSGSPLVWEKFLVGIFSWTAGCANTSFPAVFVDVGSLSLWIDNIKNGEHLESYRRESSSAITSKKSSVFFYFLLFFYPIFHY